MTRSNLRAKAKSNLTASIGTKKSSKTLAKGSPVDVADKTNTHQAAIVGMNVGCTKNMENYQSLRVDVWLSDTVQQGETVEQAYDRVKSVIEEVLQDAVEQFSSVSDDY